MGLINGWPTCAVCNKPVEKIESHYDYERLATVVTVKCHGETESAELSERLLCEAGEITFTVAFEGNTLAFRKALELEEVNPETK